MSAEPTPSPRVLRTRKLLLDAARETFARKGYEQATVADISAAAGRGHGTFYLHFPNKKAVFAALVESAIAEMTVQSREMWHTDQVERSLESSVAQFLVDFRQDRDMWSLLDQLATTDEEFRDLRASWRELLVARVRRGLESTSGADLAPDATDVRAQLLAGMLDELGRATYIEGRSRDPRALAHEWTTMWKAAAAAPGAAS